MTSILLLFSQGYVEYRNFELGVLFHSRPGVRYRAMSGACPLHEELSSADRHTSVSESDVVLLPLPYEVLGGEAYCSESGAFLRRPFFHENREVRTRHRVLIVSHVYAGE